MDFKQLEAFACVVRMESFSRAAERLYLSQPTVSAHVKALEAELGTQLIARAARAARPTEAGEALYAYALKMLALRDEAVAHCTRRDAVHGARIAIAASTVPYQHILPRAMADFRAQQPSVCFELTRLDSTGVARHVLDGRCELGLTGTRTADDQLLCTPFAEDELVLITPARAPYTGWPQDGGAHAMLPRAPFIAREPGSGTQAEAEAFLRAQDVDVRALHIVTRMDNPDAVLNAVAEGLGVAIVSRLSAAEAARSGRVLCLALAQSPALRRLYLVRHRSRPLSAAAERFAAHIIPQP